MNTNESYAVFAIAATVIMSFIYFLILERMKDLTKEGIRSRMVYLYLWRKISGFLVLGGIPAIIAWLSFHLNPLQTGFILGDTLDLWPWLAGIPLIIIILNIFNSKGADLQANYPELHLQEWGPADLSIAAGGWLIYLTGYEFLFRGLLLFSCYAAFGLWPAIVINLALYSALHLPKGLKEATAAIPFGALLCYLTLESNSILPAIFIHSVQAISIEIFCIYRNPGMNFHLLKRNQP